MTLNTLGKTTSLSTNLAAAEIQLVQSIGPQIFDYASVLSAKTEVQVNLDQLDARQLQLVQNYNSAAEKILLELGIELDNIHDPKQDFLEFSRALFQLRYLQALQDFGQYSLVKVATKLERKYLETFPQVAPPSETLVIDCEDGFVVDELGQLDIAATIAQEQKLHKLATRLSSVSELARLDSLIREIHSHITVYGMFGYLYESELAAHNIKIAEFILNQLIHTVYAYIARGYTPVQAEDNVKTYYANITKKGDQQTELGTIIKFVTAATHELVIQKTKNKAMAEAISKEYEDAIAGMLIDQLFRATNYYKLEFRYADKLDIEEAEQYQCLIDMKLLTDKGKPSDFPMETYSIELGITSRDLIFHAVTAGIENPYYTLNDYLSYQ